MDPAVLLRLMWLASPSLPVGGFSYSEGIESAADAGIVTDEAGTGDWLAHQLQLTLVRSELAVVGSAHAAWSAGDAARVATLNDWTLRTRETAELRQQAMQTGRSLLDWLRNGGRSDDRLSTLAALSPAPMWPVAYALATVLAGASQRDAMVACAWNWCENMAQAAMKAVPLGQSAAQRVLSRLASEIPAAVDAAAAIDDGDRQAYAPMLAILSSRHEQQYSRLFRS